MNATNKLVGLAVMLALVGGCQEGPDSSVSALGPPPISGGSLEVVQDGAYAVAGDPARNAIHVVDIERGFDTRIDLEENAEPGRIVEDGNGNVHVVLRRAGEVLTLDPSSATVIRRRQVCNAPRGIATDPDTGHDELVVACAEGEIVRLPAGSGGVISRHQLDVDLRDVVVEPGGRMLVSRFRSAQILMVQGTEVVGTITLPTVDETSFLSRTLEPTVAWRMRSLGGGGVILAHQQSVSSQLGTLGMPSGVYYGGGCNTGVVRPAITTVRPNWETPEASDVAGVGVDQLALGVDVAVSGGNVGMVGAAEPTDNSTGFGGSTSFGGVRTVPMSDMSGFMACTSGGFGFVSNDRPATGIAAMPGGGFAVFYRDPARLVIQDSRGSQTDDIPLDGGDVRHAGHSLFHEAAGTGATCAGCHPEGGEDGHTWAFDNGHRRNQTLLGGILETAPFHWNGDVEDSRAVMQGTFVDRMGGVMPHPAEVREFEQWVDALPAMPGAAVADHDAVERGRVIFEGAEAGCTSCHSGTLRTNNQTVDTGRSGEFDLGRTRFQVPALYEVAYRAPYMHDGRLSTLAEVVEEHEGGATLDDAQRGDLVAYLRTL